MTAVPDAQGGASVAAGTGGSGAATDARRAGGASVAAGTGGSIAATDLSVALIVRNAAALLPRCLASLPGAGAELVVVDTGSTDGTAAVARELGARVKTFPWADDFAAARNFALDQCSRGWVLMVDADEELAPGGAGEVVRWLASRRYDGYYLRRENLGAAGEKLYTDRVLRLFRRLPGYRWRGMIHESVEEAILERGGKLGTLDAGLFHHTGGHDRAKSDWYLALLDRVLAAAPDDPRLLDHLGCERFKRGEHRAALAAFERIIAGGAVYPAAYAAAGLLLAAHLDAPGRAIPYLAAAVRLDPGDRDSRELWQRLVTIQAVDEAGSHPFPSPRRGEG